jgi:hypothetical protein
LAPRKAQDGLSLHPFASAPFLGPIIVPGRQGALADHALVTCSPQEPGVGSAPPKETVWEWLKTDSARKNMSLLHRIGKILAGKNNRCPPHMPIRSQSHKNEPRTVMYQFLEQSRNGSDWWGLKVQMTIAQDTFIGDSLYIYWGLNSGPYTCKTSALSLEPYLQTFLLWTIFQLRSHIFCLGQPQTAILLPVPPVLLGLQLCTIMSSLFVEMGILLTFCLSWPQILILPISVSQTAGITSVCHHALPWEFHFWLIVQCLAIPWCSWKKFTLFQAVL